MSEQEIITQNTDDKSTTGQQGIQSILTNK